MGKVRFSCPKCKAVMQTGDDKIGYDINCPQCKHRFTLVGQSPEKPEAADARATGAERATEQTRQCVDTPIDSQQVATDTNIVDSSSPSTRSISPLYQGNAAANFSCPYCQSRQPPIWKSEVSTIGWITCILLSVTCVFFWVGLLIRDKYTICSSCKARLPRPFL